MEPDKQIPRHTECFFRDIGNDIRFFKGQQWVITNFVIAINGFVYFLADHLEGVARVSLMVVAAVTFLYGVFLLIDFQRAISDSRHRNEWIYQRYFTDEERLGLELQRPRSLLREPVIGMIALIAIACVIGTAYALLV